MSGPQGRVEPIATAPDPIDPGVRIGHVHLRTADIDRVRDFYVGVLGFDVVSEARDVPGWGTTGDALFISAGGYHHHLGFNTWKSAGGPPQPDGVAGLHHVALLYPTRAALADAVAAPAGASTGRCASSTDHGTHEAIYISDPDGNDLELAWDRPSPSGRATSDGHLAFVGGELDLEDLLATRRELAGEVLRQQRADLVGRVALGEQHDELRVGGLGGHVEPADRARRGSAGRSWRTRRGPRGRRRTG